MQKSFRAIKIIGKDNMVHKLLKKMQYTCKIGSIYRFKSIDLIWKESECFLQHTITKKQSNKDVYEYVVVARIKIQLQTTVSVLHTHTQMKNQIKMAFFFVRDELLQTWAQQNIAVPVCSTSTQLAPAIIFKCLYVLKLR